MEEEKADAKNRVLAKLYDVPVPKSNNPITRRLFAQLGQCQGFMARPAVLHFDGFHVGKLHTLFLDLVNVSEDPKRLHIIPPTSSYFKVR
jgi:hypothetical protein